MTTLDIIKRFPKFPERPIVLIVYNEELCEDAETDILFEHGSAYLEKFVTVVPQSTDDSPTLRAEGCDVYLAPEMLRFMNNGYN